MRHALEAGIAPRAQRGATTSSATLRTGIRSIHLTRHLQSQVKPVHRQPTTQKQKLIFCLLCHDAWLLLIHFHIEPIEEAGQLPAELHRVHVLRNHRLQAGWVGTDLPPDQQPKVCTQQRFSEASCTANPTFLSSNFGSQTAPWNCSLSSFLWIPSNCQLIHLLPQLQLFLTWEPLIETLVCPPDQLQLIKVVHIERKETPGGFQWHQWTWLSHPDDLVWRQPCFPCHVFKPILDEVNHIVPTHWCALHPWIAHLIISIFEALTSRLLVQREQASPWIPWSVDVKTMLLVFSWADDYFIIMQVQIAP